MKKCILLFFILGFFTQSFSQSQKIKVVSDQSGQRITIDGKDFMVNGMNWDYIPIGTNTVDANFWTKPDDIIKAGLDSEMSLLQNMNVNVIRQYTGVPRRWITYIYEKYGIYTMLNHSFGRYGLTIDGVWTPVTNYADKKTQDILMMEIKYLIKEYNNTPGLLLYLLGNENNYGLFWAGAETEDFPDEEEKKREVGEKRGRPMYKLMNDAANLIKASDNSHPVAICNGDVLFLDLVAEECPDIDIYGVNVYRGSSFGDLFKVVKEKLNKPVLLTEFGSDAYNAVNNEEDQKSQAYYMVSNWKEIYENAAGLGKAENSLGGFTFQFSDGWWKYGFDKRQYADEHNNNASWENGGYEFDHIVGKNNMNEEWFGICAKGPTNDRGLYTLYPRAAYYALKQAHSFDPYATGNTLASVDDSFQKINLMDAVLRARGDKAIASGGGGLGSKIRISNLQAKFSTFNTGGTLITTPKSADPDNISYPDKLGFDHMQSYFIGVQGNPSANMKAEVNVNILGNVATNPIDEVFYENRGREITVNSDTGNVVITDNNRVQIYSASYEWNTENFDLRGFYRTGHYHWGYEGDIFGLYPEANYGPNLDIYNGEFSGLEVDGKGIFKGFKGAFGPQLWWGANPAFLLKYRRNIAKFDVTGIFHKDIANNTDAQTSGFIPLPQTTRATLALERKFNNFGFQGGVMWGGQPLNGRVFYFPNGGADQRDFVNSEDNWGAKLKVTYQKGPFNWYASAATMGLVANGGYDQTQTFTGWKLKDNGSGNQNNFLTGFSYNLGKFQIAPNFLWQEPIVGAIPANYTALDANGNEIAIPLRNITNDPFAVRINRKTVAGELLLTYDPTPETWMYQWDNDRSEDAVFAANLGFVYRHLPTTQDAAIGFNANRSSFAFPNSVPAQDLWEINSRVVSKLKYNLGIIGNFYGGNGQANGSDPRTIDRFGGDIRVIYNKFKMQYAFKFNDWGPFDYHRDFNLTYPTQLILDLSTTLGVPDWFILPGTQVGIRGTYRTLDQYSPRYLPNATLPFATSPAISPFGFPNGSEWEIRTYININIGK